MRTAIAIALLAVLGWVALVVLANRGAAPQARALQVEGAAAQAQAGPALTVLNWNLGYAGLGEESEFIADGGNRLLAPSREIVDKNLAGITDLLARTPADVYTLQEVAATSYLNYWRPVRDRVHAALAGTAHVWLADVQSRFLPWPARLEHGMATLARARIAEARVVPLPLEPKYWFGLMRKQYALAVTRLPIAGEGREWVIANLHLAAFDDGASTRRDQLGAVLEFARTEHAKGNLVVLAGDWNMVLGGRQFPHRTEARFLDWVHPLPPGTVPEGWQLAIDPERPTVRTLHKPYVAGENFVTIIDGFMVSPNVAVENVETIDLGFRFSDHNPVLASFRAKQR